MKFVKRAMDFIARNVLLAVFGVIAVAALFVKAMYSFDDSPYFTWTDGYDVLAFALVLAVLGLIYRYRDRLQAGLPYRLCFLVYSLAAVLYVCMVPLTPFSDMGGVCCGALSFAKFQWTEMLNDAYWTVFPGNLKLSVFWGVLLLPLPKTLLTLKILNIFMIYGVIYGTRKLAEVYQVKYYNVVYLSALLFLPLFLYANHVYFDIPLVFLGTLALWLHKKYGNLILTCAVFGCARFLRKNVSIFLLAVLIVYVFEHWEVWKKGGGKKIMAAAGELLIGMALFFALYKVPGTLIENAFIKGNFRSYPAWNQIYIGLNEAEFGFMDGDFSYDRSGQDVLDRLKEYGPVRVSKILLKKTFWLWSQGTYQAQRYAFGEDVSDGAEKFEYETVLTDFLLNDGQGLRRFLNSFMRAEYLALFGLMVLTLYRDRRREELRVFYYALMGTFLILLVYELKSRYILPLLPVMLVLAGEGVEKRGTVS